MSEATVSREEFEKWCRGVIPREFEEIVADIFRSIGANATVTPQTNDGGYDIVLQTPESGSHSVLRGETALVEVKRQAGPYDVASPPVLQRLLEAAETRDPDQLIIVANRAFSDPLREQAEDIPSYPVELLTAEDLHSIASDETLTMLMNTYESHPGKKRWWKR